MFRLEEKRKTKKRSGVLWPIISLIGVATFVVKMLPKKERQEEHQVKREEVLQTYSSVFVTKTGGKYHYTQQCPGLRNAKVVLVMKQEEAEDKGYYPCEIEEKQRDMAD